jgi:Cytochrome c554 and c-prime
VTRTATALCLAALLLPAGVRATGDKVGPETCKACHPVAYERWRQSPHARATDALPERSRADARCLGCHAPDREDGLVAVTCEACHGPGRIYAARHVMRDPELARLVGLVDPGEKTCLACHTESTPSLVKFEYARKLPLIEHGAADRAARAAAAAESKAAQKPRPSGATER